MSRRLAGKTGSADCHLAPLIGEISRTYIDLQLAALRARCVMVVGGLSEQETR